MENEETIKINIKKLPMHNWAIVTYILTIIVLILLLSNLPSTDTTGISGNVISEKDIEPIIKDYINTELIPEGGSLITNIREESGIYVVTITLDGQSIPTYFTKDGKFITQGTRLISIDNPNNIQNNIQNN